MKNCSKLLCRGIKVSLRVIKQSDLGLILTNRNHPDIRKCMFDSNPISQENHEAWFSRISIDSTKKSFIYEEDGEPRGIVNFTKLDSLRGAEWGFYTFPNAPKGTGTRLGIAALDEYFLVLRGRKLNAEVLSTNPRSISFHLKLGFMEEGKARGAHLTNNKYLDIHLFGIFKDEWLLHKKTLIGK